MATKKKIEKEAQSCDYNCKMRLKAARNRFLKGLGATVGISLIQFLKDFLLTDAQDCFPEYSLYFGLGMSLLLAIEKGIQKDKNKIPVIDLNNKTKSSKTLKDNSK